jgi:hypothetical protein
MLWLVPSNPGADTRGDCAGAKEMAQVLAHLCGPALEWEHGCARVFPLFCGLPAHRRRIRRAWLNRL